MTVKAENITDAPPVATDNGQGHLKTAALRAYSRQKQPIPEEQILELLPMVPRIVQRVVTYLKPPLSFEDLVSAGTVGLIKAAKNFDPAHHAEFKTYAYIRIQGAVIDELRTWCFVPANLSRQIQKANEITQRIIEQTGAAPTNDQLAEKLGITLDQLHEIFENTRARYFLSIDGSAEDGPSLGSLLTSAHTKTPDEQFEKAELIEKLAETIQQLPQKQRQAILLYYQQNLTMKQIAELLEVTESRVSQLHAAALFNLSVKLKRWKDGR